ncbi:hypothetical protein [Nocardia xishanensis]|uniref:hypothetical protein n=1 Tax=Nocardia xishanensis TaxID=238964 RepID=UPI00340E7D6C
MRDPARTMLLGPREAFAAAQHPAWPAFTHFELASTCWPARRWQAPARYPSTSENLLSIRRDPVIVDRIELTVGTLAFVIGVVPVVVCIRRWRTGRWPTARASGR